MDRFTNTFKTLKTRTTQLGSQISSSFLKGEGEDQQQGESDVGCVPLTSDGPVIIHYSVQNNKDNDQEGSMFMLPTEATAGNISVGLIKAYFPLPGRFHFRFKSPTADGSFGGYIWVDLGNDNEPAPIFSGGISLKVLPLPDNGQAPTRPRGPVEAPAFLKAPPPVQRASVVSAASSSLPQDLNLDEPAIPQGRETSPSPPATPTKPSPVARAATQQEASPVAAAAPPPPPRAASAPTGPPSDLMHMEEIFSAPKATAVASAPPPPVVHDREELVRKREAEVVRKVEAARQDVIERRASEASIRDGKLEATNRLRHTLDSWAKKNDGTWKDIRTLLSTQHEVLWNDSGWKPVGLSDLLQDGAIKKVYRKAIIVVHPDKMKDADSDKATRADNIFQALNEAFKAHEAGEAAAA